MKLLKICLMTVVCSVFAVCAEAESLNTNIDAKYLNKKYPSLYGDEWEKNLRISPLQLEVINKIRAENQKKMNVLLMKLDTIHHEMSALADENDEQIREVLSEKQKIKFDIYKYQLKRQNNEHQGETKPSRKKMPVY